jgi:hypothetical protein
VRALALLVLVGCAGHSAEIAGTGGSGEPRCGSERWAVKTATDGVPIRQERPLKSVTVAQLSALQAPKWHAAMPRDPVESELVEAVVYLRASKFEDEDGDYHLVISDGAGRADDDR